MPRLSGKRAFVEMLIAQGVRYLFGNPGTVEQQVLDILQEYPQIEYILGLQESVSVGMADGYALAGGRPAVVNLHIAVGLANGLSMLYNAYRGGSPLIVTAGQVDSRLLMYEPSLSADLVGLTRQFAKWSHEIRHAADVPQAVRRAFKTAMQPPARPVFLGLPMDMLDEEADVEIRPLGEIVSRVRPDPAGVEQAAGWLRQAERPILVLGDRVARSQALGEAVRFAELLGAGVYTLWRPVGSEVVFPTGHPLFLGTLNPRDPAHRQALGSADLVMAVGAPLFQQNLYQPASLIGPTARVIQMDEDPHEIGKNHPIDLGIQADARLGLVDLSEAVAGRQTPTDRAGAEARIAAAGQARLRLKAQRERETQAVWNNRPISPARLAGELRGAVLPDTILVDEAFTTSPALLAAIDFAETGSYYHIRGGAIGWGLPAALGMKLARPDRPVVAVVGDGSAQYSIQALWTAAHYRIPVTYVICNNRSYRVLKANLSHYLRDTGQADRQSRFIAMDLTDPELDTAALARAYGVRSWRVEDPDALGDVLRQAVGCGEPALVDVVIDGRFP